MVEIFLLSRMEHYLPRSGRKKQQNQNIYRLLTYVKWQGNKAQFSHKIAISLTFLHLAICPKFYLKLSSQKFGSWHVRDFYDNVHGYSVLLCLCAASPSVPPFPMHALLYFPVFVVLTDCSMKSQIKCVDSKFHEFRCPTLCSLYSPGACQIISAQLYQLNRFLKIKHF